MIVKFMTFNKKYNSTLRPSNDLGTSYDCILKTSSSVISPTIELNIGLVVNPSAFNYAYIPDYNRYYWVSEWTFIQTYWVASLSVDVLASWRPYIGDFNMYVYRASAEYNGGLIDNAYPTSAKSTAIVYESGPMQRQLKDGYYIVSVYGGADSNGNINNMRYYVFTSPNFAYFMKQIYASLADNGFWQTVVDGIRNALFDLSNYIKQCWWCPYNPGNSQEAITEITVGNIKIPGVSCHNLVVNSEGYCVRFSKEFSIPKHPQANTRGQYLNRSNARYTLTYFPWGEVELSPELLDGKDYLGVEGSIDGITGQGILRVYSYSYNQNNQPYDIWDICTRTTQYLVPIPITFSNSNLFGAVQNFQYESINKTYANKNATPFLTASHFVVSAMDLFIPTMSSHGKGGSTLEVNWGRNQLQAIFFELVDEDINSVGRPLCAMRMPKNISGYIEGDSSDFSAPATDTEITMIKDFIDRGFYYE